MTILTGGLSLAAFGAAKIIRTIQLLCSAVEADGTIIEFEKRRDNRRIVYAPIVVFFTAERERVEFEGEYGVKRPKQQIGESIAVLYNPHEPKLCRIKSAQELWLPGGELIGGGFLAALISAYFLKLF